MLDRTSYTDGGPAVRKPGRDRQRLSSLDQFTIAPLRLQTIELGREIQDIVSPSPEDDTLAQLREKRKEVVAERYGKEFLNE